jgi:beta-galactosidase/beta-glucuronidase
MVLMGLYVAPARRGFDYSDSAKVQKQFEKIKNKVEQLKDHPALLGWAIGNELNLRTDDLSAFKAVNDISKMIHEIDGNHPTTTTLAGISKRDIDYIKKHLQRHRFYQCSVIWFHYSSAKVYGKIRVG